jgi:hypothetical protein
MTHKPVIAQEWTCEACNKTELTGVVMLPEGWTSGTRVQIGEIIKAIDLCQDCSQDRAKAAEKCKRLMRY